MTGEIARPLDLPRQRLRAFSHARILPRQGSFHALVWADDHHIGGSVSVSRIAGEHPSEADKSAPAIPNHMELNAMKKIILSSLVVLGLSTAAFAQAATDFASVDTDTSGGISLAEAQVAWPDLTEEAFTAADTDGNGELSVAEYDALVAASAAPAN